MNKSSKDMTRFQEIKELLIRLALPFILIVLGFMVAPMIAKQQKSNAEIQNKRLKQVLSNSVEILLEGKDSTQRDSLKREILNNK
jgi:choline-glycine betaine transporter